MNVMQIRREDVDRTHVAHDNDQWRALVNTIMNLWVPLQTNNLLTKCATIGFLRT
jgi:hypothetical protein